MKIVEGFSSMFNTFRNLFSACSALSSTAKMNAETELLEALHKKIEMDRKLSQLDDVEVEKIKEILDSLKKRQHQRKIQLVLITFPILFSVIFLFVLGEIIVEALK
jgi:nicotinate-nucleotide pyrophosphorylase